MDTDRTEEGVEILAKARQARPDLAYLTWRLARLQAQAHHPDLAIPLLLEVEAQDPGLARQARAYREDLEDRQTKDRYNDRIRALQGPPGPQALADLQALIATVHNDGQRKAMENHLGMTAALTPAAAPLQVSFSFNLPPGYGTLAAELRKALAASDFQGALARIAEARGKAGTAANRKALDGARAEVERARSSLAKPAAPGR
jgi:hypothetical protein